MRLQWIDAAGHSLWTLDPMDLGAGSRTLLMTSDNTEASSPSLLALSARRDIPAPNTAYVRVVLNALRSAAAPFHLVLEPAADSTAGSAVAFQTLSPDALATAYMDVASGTYALRELSDRIAPVEFTINSQQSLTLLLSEQQIIDEAVGNAEAKGCIAGTGQPLGIMVLLERP